MLSLFSFFFSFSIFNFFHNNILTPSLPGAEEACALAPKYVPTNEEIEGCCTRDIEVSGEDKEWNVKAAKHFEENIDFEALFDVVMKK